MCTSKHLCNTLKHGVPCVHSRGYFKLVLELCKGQAKAQGTTSIAVGAMGYFEACKSLNALKQFSTNVYCVLHNKKRLAVAMQKGLLWAEPRDTQTTLDVIWWIRHPHSVVTNEEVVVQEMIQFYLSQRIYCVSVWIELSPIAQQQHTKRVEKHKRWQNGWQNRRERPTYLSYSSKMKIWTT